MSVIVLAATAAEAAALDAPGATLVVTGLGLVNTAHALAAHLASGRRPGLVIQTGIAGAYVPAEVEVGSVLLATEEMYGDLGVITPGGWLPADVIGIPLVDARAGQPARFNQFPCDPALVAAAATSGGPLIARSGRFLTLSQVTGVRALGDELHRRFNALCESMEGAAAAHVCALHDLPFLEVRGISNLIEDRHRDTWRIADAVRAAHAVTRRLVADAGTLIPKARS